jgi:hypothetical protein
VDVNEYENIEAFHYQNFVPVADARDGEEKAFIGTDAEKFAHTILQRARTPTGAQPVLRIYGGMLLQLVWIGAILGACYFLSSGAIVVWLCDVSAADIPYALA